MAERNEFRQFLKEHLTGFLIDPPDSDFQRGYLSALLVVWTEGCGLERNALFHACEVLATSKTEAA